MLLLLVTVTATHRYKITMRPVYGLLYAYSTISPTYSGIFAVRSNIVARVTTARSVVCNMDYGIQDCDDAPTAASISNRIYGGV